MTRSTYLSSRSRFRSQPSPWEERVEHGSAGRSTRGLTSENTARDTSTGDKDHTDRSSPHFVGPGLPTFTPRSNTSSSRSGGTRRPHGTSCARRFNLKDSPNCQGRRGRFGLRQRTPHSGTNSIEPEGAKRRGLVPVLFFAASGESLSQEPYRPNQMGPTVIHLFFILSLLRLSMLKDIE